MAVCKKCGAEILWLRSSKFERKPPNYAAPQARWIPCEPDPVSFLPEEGGPDRVVTPEGDVVACRIVPPATRPESGPSPGVSRRKRGYTPHWAACPAAEEFRRKGG